MKYPRVVARFLPYLIWRYPRLKRYAKHPEKAPLEERAFYLKRLTSRLLRDFRCDVKVHGAQNLEKAFASNKGVLLVANHLSDADPLLLYSLLEHPVSFVAKEETASYIGVGTAIKSADGLFLPRKDLRASFEVMKTLQKNLETPGRAYVIFPEGTRKKDLTDYAPLPFHAGSFSGALKSGAVILPLAIWGTNFVLKPSPNPKRIPISVSYLPPIETSLLTPDTKTQDLADMCHASIEKEAKRLISLQEAYDRAGYRKIPLRKGDLWSKIE